MAPPSADSHHHHHHHHHHDHHKTIGAHNKEHFDGVASTIFMEPWIEKLCGQVSQELQDNFEWINVNTNGAEKKAKMLDYACGDGTVSRALSSHIPIIRGIDISSGMVAQYNQQAEKQGFAPGKMRAIHADLIEADATPSSELESAEFKDFDLVVMSLALHHVDNPDQMIAKLAERLNDGGVLIIVDWVHVSESECSELVPPDDSVRKMISRTGFTEKEMHQNYEKAGLVDWGWKWFASRSGVPVAPGGQMQAFISRGVKRG